MSNYNIGDTVRRFRVGDKGKTRGGLDYEVIEDDGTDIPYLTRLTGVGGTRSRWHLADGRTFCAVDNTFDLLPPTAENQPVAPEPQPSTPALQWTTIVGEKSRTYRYANGETFTAERVTRVAVRPTNHRLETADGKKFIVRGGYVAIELDTEVWSA